MTNLAEGGLDVGLETKFFTDSCCGFARPFNKGREVTTFDIVEYTMQDIALKPQFVYFYTDNKITADLRQKYYFERNVGEGDVVKHVPFPKIGENITSSSALRKTFMKPSFTVEDVLSKPSLATLPAVAGNENVFPKSFLTAEDYASSCSPFFLPPDEDQSVDANANTAAVDDKKEEEEYIPDDDNEKKGNKRRRRRSRKTPQKDDLIAKAQHLSENSILCWPNPIFNEGEENRDSDDEEVSTLFRNLPVKKESDSHSSYSTSDGPFL